MGRLWLDLWPHLSTSGQETIAHLPDPCLKHMESRLSKPDRAANLKLGLERLLRHDEALFLEGLRLYPHAACRSAEVLGPLPGAKWEDLEKSLLNHRFWLAETDLAEDQFWRTAERLEGFRDLPQPMLDFLDQGRPREEAPLLEFRASLKRFLVRERIEKLRHATYEALRQHTPQGFKIGLQP